MPAASETTLRSGRRSSSRSRGPGSMIEPAGAGPATPFPAIVRFAAKCSVELADRLDALHQELAPRPVNAFSTAGSSRVVAALSWALRNQLPSILMTSGRSSVAAGRRSGWPVRNSATAIARRRRETGRRGQQDVEREETGIEDLDDQQGRRHLECIERRGTAANSAIASSLCFHRGRWSNTVEPFGSSMPIWWKLLRLSLRRTPVGKAALRQRQLIEERSRSLACAVPLRDDARLGAERTSTGPVTPENRLMRGLQPMRADDCADDADIVDQQSGAPEFKKAQEGSSQP